MMDMRNVRRRRRWPTLAVVLAAAAGLAIFVIGRGASNEGAAVKPAATDPAAAPVAALAHKRHVPMKDGQPDHPAFSTVKLPKVMKDVLDANPDLAEYYGLEQKVVPTAEEKQKLHALLSDPDMIQQITDDLLEPEAAYSKDGEAKRMVAVEFLGDAISWGDNPAQPRVMEAIQNVIFADNIAGDAPDDLAQSLAGDKVELYTQMLGRSADNATVVAAAAKGKPVEALLSYTKDRYEREVATRLADEAQHH